MRIRRSTAGAGPDLTGVVLTGGRSIRMGRNKAFLSYGDRFFVERAADILVQVCPNVLLVGGSGTTYRGLGYRHVADAVPGLGPLGGLETAFSRTGTNDLMVLACDLPLLSAAMVMEVARARSSRADVVIAGTSSDVQPLVGVYSRTIHSGLKRYLEEGNRSVKGFLETCRTHIVHLDALEVPGAVSGLTNVNTPADYSLL